MRLILSALLTLLLAACASSGKNTAQPSQPASSTLSTSQNLQLVEGNPIQKHAALSSSKHTIDVDHGSVQELQGSDDLWSRIRAGVQIPDLQSNLVDMQTNWYAQRPDYVERMTERSKKYLYHIVEELEQRHMPTELALLPFVESAFNPHALSVAKAAGMWQFVPGTGRTFKLKQNMFQDERRDVVASTSAALDYLTKLHGMFGDWYLALAAYNWGEGSVKRAIARNLARGLPTDYQSLPMPSETRNYVPKLQAVKNIVMNPRQYGLRLPDIPNHPYFVTVTTARDIDVKVASKLAGLSLDEFRSLNPGFKQPVILGASQPQILLPFENANVFERNLKAYDGSLSTWKTYKVTERATPAVLAKKIGVDSGMLMTVNKIPAGMRLKPGSTLLVPKDDGDDEDISADVAENAVLAMEPDVPDTRKMLIRVRRGQSIAAVARRYGVTVAQIKAWNHTRRNTVMAGQRLILHVPVRRAIAKEVLAPRAGRVEKISARAQNRRVVSRYDARRGRASIVRVAEPVRSKVGKAKAGKGAAKSAGAAASTGAGKAAPASAGQTKAAVASRAKTTGDARRRKAK
ncbi:transglycosylase SLT domain-containing protein [Mycetohabitans sp. B5]|uniref:Membrane-bound lytic murein transglycosylase D n=1 Tax=Mycetohabitans endofungorum TaxID=417203 RepID=A0A2P5KER8_9BURK|nr:MULTISPECIES: transglycosylase SLT domain-containing protein [Mycetohabitans]MCG1054026.1 transglycosylase SLT domain-containing protein [Mycetohabitans sp. B5]PPB85195.1 membrane-bound lytic murein transglycosylase D [Mycetohabitans endofungorum]